MIKFLELLQALFLPRIETFSLLCEINDIALGML